MLLVIVSVALPPEPPPLKMPPPKSAVVTADGAVGQRQRRVIIVDAAAKAEVEVAVCNGQPVNGDIGARADCEDMRKVGVPPSVLRPSVSTVPVDHPLMAGVALRSPAGRCWCHC